MHAGDPGTLVTPDKPLIGSFVQGFRGGSSPWQYEVIYANRAKLLVRSEGVATSAEMAEVAYQFDFYYIHVDTPDAVLKLITCMPFSGVVIETNEIAAYSRTQPLPPPEAVEAARALEDLSTAVGTLDGTIRALPVPDTDA